jgi:hypothetical protein
VLTEGRPVPETVCDIEIVGDYFSFLPKLQVNSVIKKLEAKLFARNFVLFRKNMERLKIKGVLVWGSFTNAISLL